MTTTKRRPGSRARRRRTGRPSTIGGRHQAPERGGGRVLGVAVDGDPVREGICRTGRGRGRHRQRRGRAEAAADRDVRMDLATYSRSWPATSVATRAARWEASAGQVGSTARGPHLEPVGGLDGHLHVAGQGQGQGVEARARGWRRRRGRGPAWKRDGSPARWPLARSAAGPAALSSSSTVMSTARALEPSEGPPRPAAPAGP